MTDDVTVTASPPREVRTLRKTARGPASPMPVLSGLEPDQLSSGALQEVHRDGYGYLLSI